GAGAGRLFGLALETPGGLKVQTIHAFCTRLLHQFPFEANVAARFEVLDGAAEAKLLDEVRTRVLLEAAAEPEGLLGRALMIAISTAADHTLKDVIGEAIRKRELIDACSRRTGGVPTRSRVPARRPRGSAPIRSIAWMPRRWMGRTCRHRNGSPSHKRSRTDRRSTTTRRHGCVQPQAPRGRNAHAPIAPSSCRAKTSRGSACSPRR